MHKGLYVAATVLIGGLGWSVFAPPTAASQRTSGDWCAEGGTFWSRGARVCEVREFTLASGRVEVDASPNGGIQVEGGARGDVRVQARVEAQAENDAAARTLLAQVKVPTSGALRATGPDTRGERNWSVSYRLWVPARTDLTLRAMNGGLHVSAVAGAIDARTMNGGVHLSGVGGRVVARTTNGGLHVELGDAWRGDGLDAQTTNGGVHVTLPATLDAHLEASTVNGRIHGDLPVRGGREAGRHTLGGNVSADLGRGGPTLRLVTTNGGVHIDRR